MMKIINRFFAMALMSVIANVALAQAQVSKITLAPAQLTQEEVKAVEQVLKTKTPRELKLSLLELELFAQLVRNGNQEITASIAEEGALGLPLGTEFSSYLLREDNGFSLLVAVKTKDGSIAKSHSATVAIVPPHAELTASEKKLLEEKLKVFPDMLGLDPFDVSVFNRLLEYDNRGKFGIGYTEDDCFGSIFVRNGYYVEGYIIRVDSGVSLYYEIYDGMAEKLRAIRQTPVISLK